MVEPEDNRSVEMSFSNTNYSAAILPCVFAVDLDSMLQYKNENICSGCPIQTV